MHALVNVQLDVLDQGTLKWGGSNLQYSTSAVVVCSAPQELDCVFKLVEADVAMDGDVAPAF